MHLYIRKKYEVSVYLWGLGVDVNIYWVLGTSSWFWVYGLFFSIRLFGVFFSYSTRYFLWVSWSASHCVKQMWNSSQVSFLSKPRWFRCVFPVTASHYKDFDSPIVCLWNELLSTAKQKRTLRSSFWILEVSYTACKWKSQNTKELTCSPQNAQLRDICLLSKWFANKSYF